MLHRLLKLSLGLTAYGVSMVMMLQSNLGLMPWDVLHQGIAIQGGWPMGRVTVAVSFAVLLLWIPIRQKPGFGTLCNAIVIGLVFDAVNGLIGDRLADAALAPRAGLLLGGIVLNGAATAAYLGAQMGPGPRVPPPRATRSANTCRPGTTGARASWLSPAKGCGRATIDVW